ncbi:YicC/YloC family endoribonuclease [Agaribacterium haliotis]|uniref:YicC/YloC family endoribonuclease n=1 Tax=Agaribacterium haliotis TaxID=2013869 RepID=UPI000BB59934|nr:YicC/YloC family endoribonuclease [Agaribacterium haliotis]
MPRSMTGFARLEQSYAWGTLACEIRSVNHRYLEPSLRLPESLRAIEGDLRTALKKQLARGKVEAMLHVKYENSEQSELALNEALADNLIQLADTISGKLGPDGQRIDPLDILRWPGVIKAEELDKDELAQLAAELFNSTLDKLVENREREGVELAKLIEQRLDAIGEQVDIVEKRMPEILTAHKNKLEEKLKSLQLEVDQDRLTQELVFVAQKADVAEELDRLKAHIVEVKRTLSSNNPIGRRLDFLMQELNREANTLSSKSMASDVTQSAVDLKVFIEQMREQIQNIE